MDESYKSYLQPEEARLYPNQFISSHINQFEFPVQDEGC